MSSWLDALEPAAPDVVAAYRATSGGVEGAGVVVTGRVGEGDAERILAQQEAIGDELERVLRAMPDELLRAPGGEENWNVAQAFAHTTGARRFLAAWAALDVAGEWREERAPVVQPSVPGRADATREQLLVLLEKSRRALRESAARIAGHETQICRLDHPLVGHLRCGEWLLFVGVHDLMHLEQLHRLAGDA